MLIESRNVEANPRGSNHNNLQYFSLKGDFSLESGTFLTDATVAYRTFGRLNADQSNVVWVCHALTADTNPTDWWSGLVGKGGLIDPDQYFIVCANILGSCYGSTGPKDFNPATGERYLREFPLLTIRDIVKAHDRLRKHLVIERIALGIGGSMGGQQLLEWAILQPNLFQKLVLVACSAKSSPWGIAIRSAQRMAIEADPSFYAQSPKGGWKGLEAARAMAMVSYRTDAIYNARQKEDQEKIDGFHSESYQRYQGKKLRNRFDARSYYGLTKAMDSHDVGRQRGGVAAALRMIQAHCVVIGIQSDLLFAPFESELMASEIPNAKLHWIDSFYGHDGFLTETEQLTQLLKNFLTQQP